LVSITLSLHISIIVAYLPESISPYYYDRYLEQLEQKNASEQQQSQQPTGPVRYRKSTGSMLDRPEKTIPTSTQDRKNCFNRSDAKGNKEPTTAKEIFFSSAGNNRKKDVTAVVPTGSGRISELDLHASVILILDRNDIPKKFPKNEFELTELVTSGQSIKDFNFRDESDNDTKMSAQV
jgi:hypothetical protein